MQIIHRFVIFILFTSCQKKKEGFRYYTYIQITNPVCTPELRVDCGYFQCFEYQMFFCKLIKFFESVLLKKNDNIFLTSCIDKVQLNQRCMQKVVKVYKLIIKGIHSIWINKKKFYHTIFFNHNWWYFYWKFPSLISDASSEDVKKINIIHYILLSSAIYLCS